MALVFSKVTVSSPNGIKSFLACGIPHNYDDLDGYVAMDEYLDEIEEDIKLEVATETYTYGDGQYYSATLEELAYMNMRMLEDELFLQNHCKKIEKGNFEIEYSPKELFSSVMGMLEC